MASVVIAVVFLPHNYTLLASSEATIIDRHPDEQIAYRRDIKDNGYKSVFTKFLAGTSKEQVVDKWIRQNSHKRVNSFIDGSAFCPGAPEPCPLGLRETLECIHVILHNVMPRVAC